MLQIAQDPPVRPATRRGASGTDRKEVNPVIVTRHASDDRRTLALGRSRRDWQQRHVDRIRG
ncbi:MAG: hypothetical protein ACRYGP_04825, partial [Janthinobacterium lividum]